MLILKLNLSRKKKLYLFIYFFTKNNNTLHLCF